MKNLILFFWLIFISTLLSAQEAIIKEFHNPDSKTVLVVSHRGDWRNFAENSLEGIKSCIDMGVDIVEIDIAKTKDGQLVLMHDQTLDRATGGTGNVADYTLAELRGLRLRNGLQRVTTHYSIPTLEEAMHVAKGKILVNIDKADMYFGQVYDILVRTETLEQVIIKSTQPYDTIYKRCGEPLEKMIFMPNIKLWNENALSTIEGYEKRHFIAYEIGFDSVSMRDIAPMRKMLNGKSRIWYNALWERQSASYCDDSAAEDPHGNWGELIRLGATIIQTDRPQMLLKYLRSEGLHK